MKKEKKITEFSEFKKDYIYKEMKDFYLITKTQEIKASFVLIGTSEIGDITIESFEISEEDIFEIGHKNNYPELFL